MSDGEEVQPEEKPVFKYEFAYDDEMKELAVIIKSDQTITPEQYLCALASWLEYCRNDLHRMLKGRPSLEKNPNLN